MPLKLTCPECGSPVPLIEPLPQPGDEVQCAACAVALAVNYPPGVLEQLRARGKRFATPAAKPSPPVAPAPKRARHLIPPKSISTQATEGYADAGPRTVGSYVATEIDSSRDPGTQPAEDGFGIDRTVPGMRTPYGEIAAGIAEPEAMRPGTDVEPTEADDDGDPDSLSDPSAPPRQRLPRGKQRTAAQKRRRRAGAGIAGCLGTSAMGAVGIALLAVLGGVGAAGGAYWYYSRDLPSVETLRAYEPPTVTVVKDAKGELLGEIFDERRYVVPIDQIPKHVKDAFVSAEDANFWNHGGIDYSGILRAILRNAAQGRMAQGASTITQQVARNFLLTRDKKLERKIKEVILSWRIEDTYSKEHILYLYLNEIFLGNQAYGVEAASRAYFGKSVKDIDLAEAAILAGLPQRPSDYAPNKHFDKAKERQEYVLEQMVEKGYVTDAERKAALAEDVKIVPPENAFREQAPWFTEHVRRYLVDKYGEDAVLHQGLQVTTTCRLDLQKIAQDAVTRGVEDADERIGFRRAGIQHLASDADIHKWRDDQEKKLREDEAYLADPAGRKPAPAHSTLTVGQRYPAVVLEVNPRWARVAVGEHEGIVPVAWADWVYDPDPYRSWRGRAATDLTDPVDVDGDHKPDGAILQKGDVVGVQIDGLDTSDPALGTVFSTTPGAHEKLVAARMYQDPEIEGALLSMDLSSGAVWAMVGGSDFSETQFNRAVQSRRQVGSTFKPIVYAAAIQSRKVTAASLMADAPIAFATTEDFVWKPSNYSNDYLGNITLRRALALSRNTVTVRVLETTDPGMNHDVVYSFARALGIGGPPTYTLPEGYVPSPQNDVLCPWLKETPESTICMDHYPPRTDTDLSNTAHRAQLKPTDDHMCRACDYSMALGSASLTMEELLRAYSAFPTGGKLVEPYYVEEVQDRQGKVLEQHAPHEFPQVIEPAVASIATWLLEGVVQEGTGHDAKAQLGLVGLGGKTGTTNDEKDAWFVGFTPNVITDVWVGYDQPRSLGVSSTGGRTALPIWIDYMRAAAPKDQDRPFAVHGELDSANIDETTGRRVSSGGRTYPFLPGTVPESTGTEAGQVSLEDLTTEL